MILRPRNFYRAINRRLRRQGGFIVNTFYDKALVGYARVAPPPLPTTDPHLWMWLRSDTGVTNSSGSCYGTPCWLDQSGNSQHLNGNVANAATVIASALNGHQIVRFTASASSSLSTSAGSLNQPFSIYLLMQARTWTFGGRFIDGSGGFASVEQYPSANSIVAFAGNDPGEPTTTLALNTWRVVTAIFNGSSSSLQIDNLTAATGNVGSGNPDRVVLAQYGQGGGFFSDMDLAGLVVSAAANNSSIQLIHKNWLAYYGGLTI